METKKEILRAQYDVRKDMWKIVKKTYHGSGGWARFGERWYWGKPETEAAIEMIVRNHPEMYEKEK